jgi:DNA-binding NtrC family response regulator
MKRLDVVLVDDDADVLAAMALMLGAKYEVRTAEAVPAALVAIARRPPDAIVTDLHMRPLLGTDLLESVAGEYPGVRRVLCSAADCQAFVELGIAHAAIRKPFSQAELIAAIEGTEVHASDSGVRRRFASGRSPSELES